MIGAVNRAGHGDDDGHATSAELAWIIRAAYQGRSAPICCLYAHLHPQHEASMGVAQSIGLRPRRFESPVSSAGNRGAVLNGGLALRPELDLLGHALIAQHPLHDKPAHATVDPTCVDLLTWLAVGSRRS